VNKASETHRVGGRSSRASTSRSGGRHNRRRTRGPLAAGGVDNGQPGIREHYHPSYYVACLHDPDGHNLEAVYKG
jgi:hypothetical protein